MVKFLLVDLLDWFDDYWLSFFNISINQPSQQVATTTKYSTAHSSLTHKATI